MRHAVLRIESTLIAARVRVTADVPLTIGYEVPAAESRRPRSRRACQGGARILATTGTCGIPSDNSRD